MEESKEKVKTIFNSLDKDGSGYLELEELLQVAKELGKTITAFKMKKIIKNIDTNGDGKVSFDEFFTWWHYGNENGLEEIVFAKLQSTKYLKLVQDKLGKIGGLLSNKTELDCQEHFIGVNIGEAPPKSYLGAKVLVGQEAKSHSEQICQGFEDITAETPAVVLKIRVKDAEAAKQGFEDLFEQLMALGESLLPPEIADKYLETLKFNFSIPEPNYVTIGITGSHELIEDVINKYRDLINEEIPEEFLSSASLNLSCGKDVKDFCSSPDQQLTKIIGETELNASLDLKLNKSVFQKLRHSIFHKCQKKIQQTGKIPQKYKKIQPFFPALMIAGSRINLNFKSLDHAIKEIGFPLELKGPQTIEQALNFVKESAGNPQEMISEIPIAEDVIELFKNYCYSDISITVQVPKVAIQVYAVTDGVSKLRELLLGE